MSEKKSLTEILITPLVIAIVGAVSTFFIVQQQESNAKERHNSNQEIKLLEVLVNRITSKDENERILALKVVPSPSARNCKKNCSRNSRKCT